MKRTWTIIGVNNVSRSFQWYQSLFGLPATSPEHPYFGQVLDSDGTVLLCLHQWGVEEIQTDTTSRSVRSPRLSDESQGDGLTKRLQPTKARGRTAKRPGRRSRLRMKR